MECLPATGITATSRQHPFLELKESKRQSSLDSPPSLEVEEVQILPGTYMDLLLDSIQTKGTLVGGPKH